MSDIDFEVFKEHFPKEWISSISTMYMEVAKKQTNHEYFEGAGFYANRTNDIVTDSMIEWTDRILFPPNIAILDFVIKNIDLFSNKRIIDNGTGIGILLIFLDKLGIDCIGYDNGQQVGSTYGELIKKYNEKFGKNIQITKTSPLFPNENEVVTSSGIWCNHIQNAKMYILDSKYIDKCHIGSPSDYNLTCVYPNQINIYEKID